MKIVNISTKFLLFLGLAYLGFSCTKVDSPDEMGDAGQTVVKLITDDGLFRLKAVGLVNTPQTVDLLDVRRNIPNNSELNKAMTVIIEEDPTLVDDYNTDNGTHYVALPADKYTIDAGNPKTGNNWTVMMNNGEFAKPMKIIIPNSLNIDLSKTYAFGFRIKTVDANGKISADEHTAVVEVGVKNKYDGEYSLVLNHTGWAAYGIADGKTDTYGNVSLVTSGANILATFNNFTGTNLLPGFTADPATGEINGRTQFGAASVVFTFDLATDKITIIDNAIPDDGRGRDFVINPAAGPNDNRYDAASKTVYANFLFKQNGRPDMVNLWVLKYVGPR